MFISMPALTAHCPFIYLSTEVRTSPNMNIFYPVIYLLTYRVIHDLWTLLCGIISLGLATKNVAINMRRIVISYGAEDVLSFSRLQ